MLKPNFLLTKKISLTVYRKTQGSYVNGDWVEGTESQIIREMNVQPLKPYELMQLPESERTRAWVKAYCAEDLRTSKEGTGGYGADEFVWNGDRYEVMKIDPHGMGILDHTKAYCARVELTPN